MLAAACLLGAAPRPAPAAVAVDEEETVFTIVAPGAERVFLVGDFNAWNETLDRMVARDGRFEIRLFLLPGRYGYRFVVDGKAVADPDHPHRDDEGNSFFILAATAVGYELLFSEPGKPAAAGAETALDAAAAVRMVDDRVSLLADAGIRGETDEGSRGIFRAAVEYRLDEGTGRGYLLEGLASRRIGDGSIRAFTRSDEVGFGDPAALFGGIGPWNHPLGLFCRGARVTIGLPLGISVEGLYASRIDGERESLDESPLPPAPIAIPEGPFAGRTRRGADMAGFCVGTKAGSATFRWLGRYDRRFAADGAWRFLPATAGRAWESFASAGGWLTIRGRSGVVFDAEFLRGRTVLEKSEDWMPVSGESTRNLEEGDRLHVSFSAEGERAAGRVALERTTISGDAELREGRPGGAADIARVEIRLGPSGRSLRLAGSVERFSARNTGEVFWLEARNPWLDGDRVTLSRLPFLRARGYYEIIAGFGGDPPSGGFVEDAGFRIDLARRGAVSGGAANETLVSGWLPLPRGFGAVLDGRWIDYRIAGLDETWLDLHAGLRLAVGRRGWLGVGIGRDPLTFDRWTWSFERRGRNEFLFGRSVGAARGDEKDVLDALSAAEDELASEAVFTFEASVRF